MLNERGVKGNSHINMNSDMQHENTCGQDY